MFYNLSRFNAGTNKHWILFHFYELNNYNLMTSFDVKHTKFGLIVMRLIKNVVGVYLFVSR